MDPPSEVKQWVSVIQATLLGWRARAGYDQFINPVLTSYRHQSTFLIL